MIQVKKPQLLLVWKPRDSQEIGMEFGIEKCAMLIVKNRIKQITEWIEQPNQERIRIFGEKINGKYLGILEADSIKQTKMEEKKIRRVQQTN